jgi:hypothetical protein
VWMGHFFTVESEIAFQILPDGRFNCIESCERESLEPWFPAPHLAHDSCRRRRVRIGEALLLRRTKRLEPNQSCRLVIAVYWSKL